MAKISIVNSFDVREEEKLSAETFRPEYLEVVSKLKKLTEIIYFGELISKIVNGDEIRTFVKKGLFYIRVSDMDKFFVKTKDMVKIPKNSKIKRHIQLSVGDILISRSGTIGVVAIATPEIKNAIISSHIIRIALKQINHLNPYYVCAFLNSRYGQLQILQKSYGGVVPEISQEGLKRLLIYRPSKDFQLHIEQLVKQAYEKRKLAEQKYKQAENLLYELLGISKEEIARLEAEKTYETSFKEVKQAFRFDAEYYHPKYYLFNKIFKQIPYVRLGDKEYFELKKGIEVGSEAYCDKNRGILFLRVSNLSKDGLKLNPSDKYVFKGIYEKLKSKYEPKKGEILFSKDGTIGTAIVVDSDFPPSLISGGIVRIRIKKDFDPYYLAFVLNSIVVELQVMKEKTGAVIEHLRFSKLKEIKVPKLPQSQQQEIANLVKEYFKLRKEARQLVQRAIREVEEAIESASRSNGER